MTILEHKYPNGFRIIYEQPLNKIPVSGVYLFCNVGPVYEYNNMRGASHFIEHMCFKGTKLNPNSVHLMNEFSKIGAYFNAVTTKRYTCYTIKCMDDYLAKSIYNVSDMLINSIFNKEEFNKEHKVVLEELNNLRNDPYSKIDDEIERMLFKGSSYEYPIDDLEYHNKNSLKYNKIMEFYKAYYHPSNMFLSIVTHVPLENIKQMLKNTFFLKEKTPFAPIIMPVLQLGIEMYNNIQYNIIQSSKISNVLLSIGFRTCSHNSIEKYYLYLLSVILGSTINGRLMKILREKHGLVYSTRCEVENYEHGGKFTFFTETKFEHFLTNGRNLGVLPLLINIINDIKKNGVTNEEIKNSKGNIKGQKLLNLESISLQTKYNGEEYLFIGDSKQIVPYSKIYDKYIKGITKENITYVINKYINKKNMCVCVISNKALYLEKLKRECEKIF
jgi:predicted Zn-dependent peptidase